jgi:hypothetical protein
MWAVFTPRIKNVSSFYTGYLYETSRRFWLVGGFYDTAGFLQTATLVICT